MSRALRRLDQLQLLARRDPGEHPDPLDEFPKLLQRLAFEIGSGGNLVFTVGQTEFAGDRQRGHPVITSHHGHQHACLMALSHRIADTRPQGIDHSEESEQHQLLGLRQSFGRKRRLCQ